MYSLRDCAVQEFNGQRWFGIHPLVVDSLAAQGRLTPSTTGVVLGGTISRLNNLAALYGTMAAQCQ